MIPKLLYNLPFLRPDTSFDRLVPCLNDAKARGASIVRFDWAFSSWCKKPNSAVPAKIIEAMKLIGEYDFEVLVVTNPGPDGGAKHAWKNIASNKETFDQKPIFQLDPAHEEAVIGATCRYMWELAKHVRVRKMQSMHECGYGGALYPLNDTVDSEEGLWPHHSRSWIKAMLQAGELTNTPVTLPGIEAQSVETLIREMKTIPWDLFKDVPASERILTFSNYASSFETYSDIHTSMYEKSPKYHTDQLPDFIKNHPLKCWCVESGIRAQDQETFSIDQIVGIQLSLEYDVVGIYGTNDDEWNMLEENLPRP